jgi:hypothetical protein
MRTATVVVCAAAVLTLAGCSSSDTTGSPTPAVTSASPEASLIGPIIVEPSQTQVAATVGRAIVFDVGDDPGAWDIATDNEAVVSVQKGGERDGATFNPGAEALSEGEATVTLTDAEGMDALEFTITVTQ